MTRPIPAEAGTEQRVGACQQDNPTLCAVALTHAAIEANDVRECCTHRLIVAADVIMLSGIANGEEMPAKTWRLGRADGRSASVYRLPAEVVA